MANGAIANWQLDNDKGSMDDGDGWHACARALAHAN
jgi:hypothetical protein